ncbi:hypothetical protein AB0M12_15095 [Nocardia vinacea]|uniref:hypothetical protein n=1 Tax=Nocardia vinacea TaxID=96468 RepID=UPI0034192D49
MLGKAGIRHSGARSVAAAVVMATAVVLAGSAGVSANPGTGSAGSSDGGSSGGGSGSSGSSGGGQSAPPQTQRCNQSTKSGGAGVTDTMHQLGRSGPASFVLVYETYSIPDLIEVFYEGSLIRSTGYVGDNINEGTGSVVVNVPPGSATAVLVRVTGPNGTDWEYTVKCPA